MAEFAGYEMPISYDPLSGGMKSEHLKVRQASGMFDVSHMGEFRISGPQAAEFLSWVCTRPVQGLALGRAQYALLLNSAGGIVDDVIVYKIAASEFFMVVNASNIEKDFAHLQKLTAGFDVRLVNESEKWALIAIQGPEAMNILSRRYKELDQIKYYSFRVESDCILSHTGYTGEDGLEIFLPPSKAPELWDWLFKAGVCPIGLGARDTLRLEVGFPLYGHELTDELFPSETMAAFAFDKAGRFYGKDRQPLHPRQQAICLLGDSPKPFRAGEKIFFEGQGAGELTSGSYSPILKRGMAVGLVAAALDLKNRPDGFIVEVESGGKLRQARLTTGPFVETSRVKRKIVTPAKKYEEG